MDGNKDAALKCLRIGKEALEAGDRNRAIRFLSKAQRLDPSLAVDDLLSSVSAEGEPTKVSSSSESTEIPAVGSFSSKFPGSEKDASSGDLTSVYTEEQVLIVRNIKKEKDYYKILGLERSCSMEDVKKAYRKLSLKVHPDKNKAPGSEEAFKTVSKAFQCLGEEETRKRYDLVGSEEPVHVNRHDQYGFNGFYETDIDADEIFRNFFFGGGMAPATTPFGQFRFRAGGMRGGVRAHDVHGSSNSNLRALLQVLPIIVLLLANFLPSSDPPYALSRSYSYDQQNETPRGVPFFVKQGKFEQEFPRDSAARMALEQRIEREYVSIVSQHCQVELQRQQWGFSNQTPHCDMLQKYETAAALVA